MNTEVITYKGARKLRYIRRKLENGHTGDIYFGWDNICLPPMSRYYFNKVIDLLRTYPNFYLGTCSIGRTSISLIPYIGRIRDEKIELVSTSYELLEELGKYLPNCSSELKRIIVRGGGMPREEISMLRDALHASPQIKELVLPTPQEFYPDGLFKNLTFLDMNFNSQQVPRLAKILRNSKLEEVILRSYFTSFTSLALLIQGLPPTIKTVHFCCSSISGLNIQDCHWYLMRHPNYTVPWSYGLNTRLNKIILISRILPPGLFRQFVTCYLVK